MGRADSGLEQSVGDLATVVKKAIDELSDAVWVFRGIINSYREALSKLEMSGALVGPAASAEAAVAVASKQGTEAKDGLDSCLRNIPKRRSRVTEALARVTQLRAEIRSALELAKQVAEVTVHERSSPYGKHLESSQRCWSDESSALVGFWRELHNVYIWAHKEIEQAESKMEFMRNVNKPMTPQTLEMLDRRKQRRKRAKEQGEIDEETGLRIDRRETAPDVG